MGRHDGLQNMVSRTASGPTSLDVLTGNYQFGGTGFGPRQLAKVVTASGDVNFAYDLAGRVTSQGGRTHTYNGLDQLVSVTIPGTGGGANTVITHSYGYDGLRTVTEDGTNSQYWFTPNLVHRGSNREWYLKLGDRTVARLSLEPVTPTASLAPFGRYDGIATAFARVDIQADAPRGLGAVLVLALVAVLGVVARGRERMLKRLGVGGMLVALFGLSCQPPIEESAVEQRTSALWSVSEVVYFHGGLSAGPQVLTREDGSVFEERRYEPFGVTIDAFRELSGGGTSTGAVDFRAEPLNILNKETEPGSGYSYHGARWMAPRTALWLTPDPPVKAPDPKFLVSPWDLNPYQYVRGNPVIYWDPDGEDAYLFFWAPDRAKDDYGHVAIAVEATPDWNDAGRESRTPVKTEAHLEMFGKYPAGRNGFEQARIVMGGGVRGIGEPVWAIKKSEVKSYESRHGRPPDGVIVLRTTPDQDEKMLDYFRKPLGNWAAKDNCATYCNWGLYKGVGLDTKAGIEAKSFWLKTELLHTPSRLYDVLTDPALRTAHGMDPSIKVDVLVDPKSALKAKMPNED